MVALALAAIALTAAASDPTAGMSTRQLAGQHIVTGFTGSIATKALLRRIHRGELGGVILFSSSIRSRPQLRRLTASLQKARPKGAPPLIVSIDQEGGQVKRLSGAPSSSASAMGSKGSAKYARRQGVATAHNLRSVGVNVDLAPVLDVARPGSIMERQQRSFSRSAPRVARIGGAFARGLVAGNVASTGKHFPGLGAARLNQDVQVNRIKLKLNTLRHVDERPYSAAPGALDLVMLSSAIYPALSGGPAVFSTRVVNDELRGHVGFKGVTITDALDAPAMGRYGSIGRRSVRATKAGVDLLLFTDDGASVNALVHAMHNGQLSRAALRESTRRALKLRASLR